MENFNSSKCLPKNMILKSAESHLYRIGLCLSSTDSIKRSKFHNPLLVFIINCITLIKCIISLLSSEENETIFIIIGDFSYFVGIKTHYNITIAFYVLMATVSQIINYYNDKHGIELKYLNVFKMMSGSLSPKSVGLMNREQIYKMIKQTKLLFSICKNNNEKVIPLVTLTMTIVPLLINCSILDTIIFGIPNSILTVCCFYYINNINLWQITYFYIICNYIKIKLREQNDNILVLIKRKTKIRNNSIAKVIRSISCLYSEINDYNISYWSKYLLSIWLIFVIIINTFLYLTIFGKMITIIRVVFIYISFLFIMGFLFIINTASSVNYEANKSYKLLNQLMSSNSKLSVKVHSLSNLNEFYSRHSSNIKVQYIQSI